MPASIQRHMAINRQNFPSHICWDKSRQIFTTYVCTYPAHPTSAPIAADGMPPKTAMNTKKFL